MQDLDDDEGGILREEDLPADPLQVGKQLADTPKSRDVVDQQVLRDLPQARETDGFEVREIGELHQDDLDETFYHCAVLEPPQALDAVVDPDTSADRGARRLDGQENDTEEEAEEHGSYTRHILNAVYLNMMTRQCICFIIASVDFHTTGGLYWLNTLRSIVHHSDS